MLGSRRPTGAALAVVLVLILAGTLFLLGLWAPAPPAAKANLSSPWSIFQDGEQFKTLRVYGRDNETAGADRSVAVDRGTDASPEDPPYTNPSGPFLPQLNEAPRKDSVTWNPAWMNEFEIGDTDELDAAGLYEQIGFGGVKNLQEKVWFRMWYEPEHLDKDLNNSGDLDRDTSGMPTDVDEWYPAIMEEFTYLLVDQVTGEDEPASGPVGGANGPVQFAFPVGVREEDLDKTEGFGLTSFNADFDGNDIPEIVRVYSEFSLFAGQVLGGNGVDFNNNDTIDPLDSDATPLTGDEVAILSPQLPAGVLGIGDKIQFLEHVVEVRGVGATSAQLRVTYNGSTTPHVLASSISLPENQVLVADHNSVGVLPSGCATAGKPFFVYLAGTSQDNETVTLVIGRAVGGAYGAMDNPATGGEDKAGDDPWYLKRFYVDGHEYNVVALMTQTPETPPSPVTVAACTQPTTSDTSEFQYITLRTPVPKAPIFINQHSIELQAYEPVT